MPIKIVPINKKKKKDPFRADKTESLNKKFSRGVSDANKKAMKNVKKKAGGGKMSSKNIDGLLARLFREESKLGELLDPIADKILVSAALILLVMNGTIKNYEVIAAVIILTREILVSGLREFLAKGRIAMEVTGLSKLKTLIQMASIAILLTGDIGNKIINFQDYNAQTIGIILLWLSAFLTLYTGYDYLIKGIDHAINEDNKD